MSGIWKMCGNHVRKTTFGKFLTVEKCKEILSVIRVRQADVRKMCGTDFPHMRIAVACVNCVENVLKQVSSEERRDQSWGCCKENVLKKFRFSNQKTSTVRKSCWTNHDQSREDWWIVRCVYVRDLEVSTSPTQSTSRATKKLNIQWHDQREREACVNMMNLESAQVASSIFMRTSRPWNSYLSAARVVLTTQLVNGKL